LTPLGTVNPLQQQNSFLVVTKGGELKLFFSYHDRSSQQDQWIEKSIELQGLPQTDNIITHAAFALQARGASDK
jgi:hypothetical protein